MALRLVTPPTEWLLSRDEAKAALAVDYADDDALIDAFIQSAHGVVEAETQRLYCAQVLDWVRPDLCPGMTLPVAPGGDFSKIEVVSITYADFVTGAGVVLDPAKYWAMPAGRTLAIQPRRFVYWPLVGDAAEPVVIRFKVTSTPADAAPEVKTAMRLLVAHFYKHREAVVGVENRDSSAPLPFGVEQCLVGERW
jgi:uncharacterized phiE125 gp8 family phage protein